MVDADRVEVERRLMAGDLSCPSCSGALHPWGHARWRTSRGEHGQVRWRPRRANCRACNQTHVLLPQGWLLRRADEARVIGAALLAKATGLGHRPIAVMLDRPASTVRGWLRRFNERAEDIRVFFTGLLHALDPQAHPLIARGSVFADAIEVLGRAAAATVARVSPQPPWEFASRASGGLLLAPGSGPRAPT